MGKSDHETVEKSVTDSIRDSYGELQEEIVKERNEKSHLKKVISSQKFKRILHLGKQDAVWK